MSNKQKISKQKKGRIGEYRIMSELMELGFDVYSSVADDKGIDFLLRVEKAGGVSYYDCQVKSLRESKQLFGVKPEKFSKDALLFVLILHSKKEDEIYFFTSKQVKKYGAGGHWGDFYLTDPKIKKLLPIQTLKDFPAFILK